MARSRFKANIKRAMKTAVFIVGKRVPGILTAARATFNAMRARTYRSLWQHNPVNPSVAVFESFMGRGFSCSPRALYQAMLRDARYDGVEKVWALRTSIVEALAERGGFDIRGLDNAAPARGPKEVLDSRFSPEALEELRRAVIVPWGSPEYYRTYARAGLWVTNSVIPTYLKPREGQSYVQTWHGTPLKRLGCDIQPGVSQNAVYSAGDMHRRYSEEGARLTWLLSPSRYATERFASAFDLQATGRTGAILEEGYPRNDCLSTFTAADAARIKARLGVPADKKVVLYAPTWRDNQHVSGVGYTYETEADFAELRRVLGDGYVVLFRAHYFVANAFDFAAHDGFVVDVSKTDDINELYIISDMLVTDYSSVFFDYANLRRPMSFYMYDLDYYAEELRGFYIGLDDLPGPIVKTTAALAEAILATGEVSEQDAERYDRFCARFNYLDDGHASERVLARVMPRDGSSETA